MRFYLDFAADLARQPDDLSTLDIDGQIRPAVVPPLSLAGQRTSLPPASYISFMTFTAVGLASGCFYALRS